MKNERSYASAKSRVRAGGDAAAEAVLLVDAMTQAEKLSCLGA